MLALLLALSSDCTGLVPPVPLPAPVQVSAGSPSDSCALLSVDGSGDVAALRNALGVFFASDGTALGTSDQDLVLIGTPAQARGWYGMRFSGSGAQGVTLVYAADRDGTLLGQTQIPNDPGSQGSSLQRDPRGGLVLFSMRRDGGGWVVDVRHFSSQAALVDGPLTIASGKGAPPPGYEWQGRVAADGSLLLTLQGTHVPPLRNNQLVARWFDPAGAPLTPWFVALDQTTEGGQMLALPGGGMALWGDSGQVAIRPGETAVSATPPWIPADRYRWGSFPAYVLPDRIAIPRTSFSPCEEQLDILAPAGNLCGTLHFPMPAFGGVCRAGFGPAVAADGTVVQDRYDADSCRLRWWPQLLHGQVR
ncbi:MAG TPA: hypothetical protein VI356_14015 [Myxococcales bacterium]